MDGLQRGHSSLESSFSTSVLQNHRPPFITNVPEPGPGMCASEEQECSQEAFKCNLRVIGLPVRARIVPALVYVAGAISELLRESATKVGC